MSKLMKKENLLTNTLLEDMGRKFRVFAVSKNLKAPRLRGFS
jgi:hypothetical protein